ncbi:hypothetical protein JXA32_15110 [Candidatus Sumerlaeota bacterium]|nr:hypothetical protein [Candidatus Sumerlaeota bacterium]
MHWDANIMTAALSMTALAAFTMLALTGCSATRPEPAMAGEPAVHQRVSPLNDPMTHDQTLIIQSAGSTMR